MKLSILVVSATVLTIAALVVRAVVRPEAHTTKCFSSRTCGEDEACFTEVGGKMPGACGRMCDNPEVLMPPFGSVPYLTFGPGNGPLPLIKTCPKGFTCALKLTESSGKSGICMPEMRADSGYAVKEP